MKHFIKSLAVSPLTNKLFIAMIAMFIALLGLTVAISNELNNLRIEIELCKHQIANLVNDLDLGEMEQGDYEMESTLTA
ncbi:MAG: hypothetical protein RLY40_40 [Pseudomonadota bacterium]|jgi:hypothetical protein